MTRSSAPASPAPAGLRFGALRHPDYRRYIVTTIVGLIAENIEHVISYFVIFQAFHSPTLGGFAVISHWVPYLLFSVYSGALADRFDCRKLILVSQGLFMLASLSWGVLFLTGTLQTWHAGAILLIHGAAGVIYGPAGQLVVHDIVGTSELYSAIRLNATARYLATLLGPAIGGGLMLALGPGWGLVANLVLYLPLCIYLMLMPYTGHSREGGAPPRRAGLGLGDVWRVFIEARAEPRIITMIVLAGATSFFVGNAFQVQMPEYAHDLGADDHGAWYSVLLAANAAGGLIGVILLESVTFVRAGVRFTIGCAAAWAMTMALFAMAGSYRLAVSLLILAGLFNVAYTSMAQTLVQLLAPPRLRGRTVGLFGTAMWGLRAGSGVTIGVLGAAIDIHRSLAINAIVVALIALALLARDVWMPPASGAAAWREER
ncbi:MAG TPA: MFS transporter [Candidatus Acidoferrum sp.]|nr:MFS transporter [Candidatus Acidoferrum sp.]